MRREKRLVKSIESLEEQIKLHKDKIETEEGDKDTTKDYWREEIKRFEEEIKKKKRLLEREEV